MGNWADIVTQELFGDKEREVTANDESEKLEGNSN